MSDTFIFVLGSRLGHKSLLSVALATRIVVLVSLRATSLRLSSLLVTDTSQSLPKTNDKTAFRRSVIVLGSRLELLTLRASIECSTN